PPSAVVVTLPDGKRGDIGAGYRVAKFDAFAVRQRDDDGRGRNRTFRSLDDRRLVLHVPVLAKVNGGRFSRSSPLRQSCHLGGSLFQATPICFRDGWRRPCHRSKAAAHPPSGRVGLGGTA